MQSEPAETRLLLFGVSLQHRLVEANGILVVVIAAVQSQAEDFPSTVDWANPPHRHPCTQTVEVSAGQQVGLNEDSGGRSAAAAGGDGSPATALRVVELPGWMLEIVQHLQDTLLSVRLVEEKGDSQRRVACHATKM